MSYGIGYKQYASYDGEQYITRRFQGGPADGYDIPISIEAQAYQYVAPDKAGNYEAAGSILVGHYHIGPDGSMWHQRSVVQKRPKKLF